MHKRSKFGLIVLSLILGFFLTACSGNSRSGDASPVKENVSAGPISVSEEAAGAEETIAEAEAVTETPQEAETPLDVPSESDRPVITFSISGGIVGFCDFLIATEAGEYRLQSCDIDEMSGQLEQTDLDSLQAWHNDLVDFELTFEGEVGEADGLVSELKFRGRGSSEANETQRQEIFDWVNSLIIRLRPQAVAAPPTLEPPEIGPDGLCPDIKRPAVLVANFESPNSLILVDSDGQTPCDVVLTQPPFGRLMTAAGSIYYPIFDLEAQTITVWQLSPAGAQTPLTFTTVTMEQPGPFSFALARDGTRIAWTRTMIEAEIDPPRYRSDLWIADIDGSNKIALLEAVENEAGRFLELVRIAEDGRQLFYALQPDELDPAVENISGRYDNVYRLPTGGGQPELWFACSTDQNPVCIGDVSPDGRVLALTPPAEGVVQLISSEGSLINTLIAPATDYVGRAVFGPTGRLAFVSAVLSQSDGESPPNPDPGYISLVEPPYTDQPRTLLADNTVVTPWEWLDEDRLAFGAIDEAGNVGTAIVTLDGQVTKLSPNFALAVLW